MGFFSVIGGAIKSLFGGGSSGGGDSSSTVYEPDKVKVAEIESDTKIRLAHLENDRIELMKQARMDILQFETESQIALEQAKAQGLGVMAQTILTMQQKLNEVAKERLEIIEKGSLQVIRDIEMFYDELGTKIQEDFECYKMQKMPQLLSILENYKEGSAQHKIYQKMIEDDWVLQVKHYDKQIDAVHERQKQVIGGFLQSKERILEQTGEITAGMLETIQKQTLALGNHSAQGEGFSMEIPVQQDRERLALPEREETGNQKKKSMS